MSQRSTAVFNDLKRILGESTVHESGFEKYRYERGYRYGEGRALAIIRPGNNTELRTLIRYCFSNSIKIVIQGANTGLVGASTPDSSGEQLLISMERMRGIEALDVNDRTATVLSGTRLSALNDAVSSHHLWFPIDLSADPSLGGMVATNTGGSRLIKYGDMQRNLVGLEVVLPDSQATTISDLNGLRKDNSGVDLKQLFIGTSGTFGVITRVQVELQSKPAQCATALVIPTEHAAIPSLLKLLETRAGEFLTAFEGMSSNALRAAFSHNSRLRNPFPADELPAYALLLELCSSLPPSMIDLEESLAGILNEATELSEPLISNAYIARPEDLWPIRHSISDGIRRMGTVIGMDIAVPRSALPSFRAKILDELARECPGLQVFDFGHCGDGGDHFNLVWPNSAGPCNWETIEKGRQLVYNRVVVQHGGSFSAEHGLGPHNIDQYKQFASRSERGIAASLKQIFDPRELLGRVALG